MKYLGQKNAMLEPFKMKHTQTLVVFRQIFQIGVDFIMKIPDSLKISEFSLNTWLLKTLATLYLLMRGFSKLPTLCKAIVSRIVSFTWHIFPLLEHILSLINCFHISNTLTHNFVIWRFEMFTMLNFWLLCICIRFV